MLIKKETCKVNQFTVCLRNYSCISNCRWRCVWLWFILSVFSFSQIHNYYLNMCTTTNCTRTRFALAIPPNNRILLIILIDLFSVFSRWRMPRLTFSSYVIMRSFVNTSVQFCIAQMLVIIVRCLRELVYPKSNGPQIVITQTWECKINCRIF